MNTTTTHSTRIVADEPETMFKDGAYRLECSCCGHWATYRGYWFAYHEAQAHERYFAKYGK